MRLCPTHQNQVKTCSMGSVAEGGAEGTTPLWHVEGNQTWLGKGQGSRHYLSGAKCPGSWQFRSSEERERAFGGKVREGFTEGMGLELGLQK